VALFPTKERVYAKLLERADYTTKHQKLAEALRAEAAAREAIDDFLNEHKFEVIDLLPALESEVLKRDLYPVTDAHPNKDGYRLIAETISRYLNETR
jgi:hypothetical protein